MYFANRCRSFAVTFASRVDPANHSLRVRYDTAEFRGTATLRYPDRREFRTSTTMQQTREFTAFTAPQYDSAEAARNASRPPFSMFNFPSGPLEERLAAGDRVVRDSLLSAMDRSRNAESRLVMLRQLQSRANGFGNTPFADTLRAHLLQSGDTARVVGDLLDPARTPLTVDRLRLIVPFVRDPGLAFAWGIPASEFYENAIQRIGEYPPALASSRQICVPDACRALAALRDTKGDARLQRVGRFAAFMLDPRGHIGLVERDTTLVAVHNLIAGIAATGQGSLHPTMPPVGSFWPQWLVWMNGAPDTGRASLRPPGTPPALRFDDNHRHAVEFAKLLYDRDVVAEWQATYRLSANDLERYVYETMLAGMDAWRPDRDSVTAWITGDTKLARARGARGADMLMADAHPITDIAVLTSLIDRALAHAIDGEVPWTSLDGTAGPGPVGQLLDNAQRPGRGLAGQDSQTIYVKTPVVTGALRLKWGAQVTWITDSSWRLDKTMYPASVVTISTPYGRAGLAIISVDIFSARNGKRGIDAGEGGNRYFLILTKEGWRIIDMSTWVV